MIRYRPFLNSDPPLISEIWRSNPPQRGMVQSVSPAQLEQFIFSKPYFDRHGLILAFEGEHPVGFVHAGFGPSDDRSALNTELGTTCMLMVNARDDLAAIAGELLNHAEQYLIDRGAREVYAGASTSGAPFYLGLYGGSQLSGVLASDTASLEAYAAAGYEESERQIVFQRSLIGFRPLVDRTQMKLRRRFQVEEYLDPPAEDWWEACTFGSTNRVRFWLDQRGSGRISCGQAALWDVEPLASNWGVRAAGVVELKIDESERRQGLGTFLLGESLRQMQSNGAVLAEAHVPSTNAAGLALFNKLGFEQTDESVVMRKSISR